MSINSGPRFEYGPFSRGVYYALICFTVLVPQLNFDWLFPYLLFLVFLGFGLKPLLIRTGIHALFQHSSETVIEKLHEGHNLKRREEVARQQRSKKLRRGHRKHPDLPKDW